MDDPRFLPDEKQEAEWAQGIKATMAAKKAGVYTGTRKTERMEKPKAMSRTEKMWRQANNILRKKSMSETQAWLKTLPLDADGTPVEANEWRAIFRTIQKRGRARQNGG